VPTRYAGEPDEVRALNAHIKLMRASGAVRASLDRHLNGLGLTENQFGVLETLLHLGPLHQRLLGQKLFTSGANITVIVDNLQKRHLVRRDRDREDRRQVTVSLTPEGRHLIESVFPAHAARIAALYRALSAEEQDALGALSKKLGLATAAPASAAGAGAPVAEPAG
jgi:MarR family 2-MHQ and catechol resistance regulon transcriptional repressor